MGDWQTITINSISFYELDVLFGILGIYGIIHFTCMFFKDEDDKALSVTCIVATAAMAAGAFIHSLIHNIRVLSIVSAIPKFCIVVIFFCVILIIIQSRKHMR